MKIAVIPLGLMPPPCQILWINAESLDFAHIFHFILNSMWLCLENKFQKNWIFPIFINLSAPVPPCTTKGYIICVESHPHCAPYLSPDEHTVFYIIEHIWVPWLPASKADSSGLVTPVKQALCFPVIQSNPKFITGSCREHSEMCTVDWITLLTFCFEWNVIIKSFSRS